MKSEDTGQVRVLHSLTNIDRSYTRLFWSEVRLAPAPQRHTLRQHGPHVWNLHIMAVSSAFNSLDKSDMFVYFKGIYFMLRGLAWWKLHKLKSELSCWRPTVLYSAPLTFFCKYVREINLSRNSKATTMMWNHCVLKWQYQRLTGNPFKPKITNKFTYKLKKEKKNFLLNKYYNWLETHLSKINKLLCRKFCTSLCGQTEKKELEVHEDRAICKSKYECHSINIGPQTKFEIKQVLYFCEH